MEDALDPEHGAWSLCDHCANAWHEEQMDSTPYASPRSVVRGRLRSSSVEPKREQRGRSPEGALEDREETEHKRNEIYQQLLNLPEDGGQKPTGSLGELWEWTCGRWLTPKTGYPNRSERKERGWSSSYTSHRPEPSGKGTRAPRWSRPGKVA